jgi:hypothetical protein
MFNAQSYIRTYRRIMGPLSVPVSLQINDGTSFRTYPSVMAYVTKYKESDLIAGGSIQIGDLKIIIMTEDLPRRIESMGRKDRIEVDGRNYSVIHWGDYTRTIGEVSIAVEIGVRG